MGGGPLAGSLALRAPPESHLGAWSRPPHLQTWPSALIGMPGGGQHTGVVAAPPGRLDTRSQKAALTGALVAPETPRTLLLLQASIFALRRALGKGRCVGVRGFCLQGRGLGGSSPAFLRRDCLLLPQHLGPRSFLVSSLPSSVPGESHGQRSLASYNPGGHKESDRTQQLSLTHSVPTRSPVYLCPQECGVSGEVGKSSCIALPGRGGHRTLMPSGLCVPPGGDSEESKVLREQGRVSSSSDWLVVRSLGVSTISLSVPTILGLHTSGNIQLTSPTCCGFWCLQHSSKDMAQNGICGA